jgi:hypothetical protein
MSRFIAVFLAAFVFSPLLHAGPVEDAQAAFDKFFPSFVQGNCDAVSSLFAPDAQFYGTLSRDLVTAHEGVRQYFGAALCNNPAPVKAMPLGSSALALSDSVVLISGAWHGERVVDGKPVALGPFRVSAVLAKRGDRWLIVQFHNSPRPAPTSPAPAR